MSSVASANTWPLSGGKATWPSVMWLQKMAIKGPYNPIASFPLALNMSTAMLAPPTVLISLGLEVAKSCFAIAFDGHQHCHHALIVISTVIIMSTMSTMSTMSSIILCRDPQLQHQLPHLLLHRAQLPERVLGAAATQKKDGTKSPSYATCYNYATFNTLLISLF